MAKKRKTKPKPKLKVSALRELAEMIAERLFTAGNVGGTKAARLVLEREGGGDLGGWCEKAAADQIEDLLDEHATIAVLADCHQDH